MNGVFCIRMLLKYYQKEAEIMFSTFDIYCPKMVRYTLKIMQQTVQDF